MPTTPTPGTDPTVTPTMPDLTGSIQQTQTAKTATEQLTTAVTNLAGSVSNLVQKFMGSNTTQKEGIDLTKSSADVMDVLSIGVLKASDAFALFSKNSEQAQTFTEQLHGLGTATSLVSDTLMKLATAGGASSSVLQGGAGVVKNFVEEMSKAADNALHLQQGYLAMAGATGTLGRAYEEAGPNLINLNDMMLKQRTLLDEVASATGASTKQTAAFYAELGTAIPDSVNKQVNATGQAGQSMNGLQAVMTVAAGTGRDVASVIKDLSTAYEDYNLTGERALEFTTRMSDLSNRFGINLSYTEGFLKQNADAFKLLGASGSDVDQTFNRMFTSFTSTGLSAKQSTDIIGGLTSQMAHLTVAQKAFLSAQSGGPGGLRGAYQIDNMLKDGKTDEVLKMVEDNLKKHFGGKIYTQEDAGQSDFAAAQFTKQRAMLQSGAFGGLVKQGPEGDATAARILEAMQAGTSATQALEPANKVLQDTITQGQNVQETSNTILNKILHELETSRGIAENRALDTVQKYGSGTVRTDREVGQSTDNADRLRLDRRTLGTQGASNATEMVNRGAGNNYNVDTLRSDNMKKLGTDVAGVIPEALKSALGFGDKPQANNSEYTQSINNLTAQQQEANRQLQQSRNQVVNANYNVQTGRGVGSAAAVDQATGTAGQAPIARLGTARGRPGDAPVPVQTGTQKVEIKVHGIICESCAKPIKTDPHTNVVTSGA